MARKDLNIIFVLVVIAGIISYPVASYGAVPSGGKQPASQEALPDQVKEAIKNRIDYVEIPVTPVISRIYWIDYAAPAGVTPASTDCGPDSNSYKRWRNFRWFSFPVRYQIDTSGVSDPSAKQAVVNAFNTWDAENAEPYPATEFFSESTPASVTVAWAPIDGAGSTLAITSLRSVNMITGEIYSASVTYDSDDSWKVYGSFSCSNYQDAAFDIEEIGTHEIGHIVGLDHVRGKRNIAQTMYPYAWPGETLRRTLGTGDARGIAAIYG